MTKTRIMIVWAALMLAIWAQSYAGRLDIRATQLRGCVRGQQDRRSNANGWESARLARQSAANRETGAAQASDQAAADSYAHIVADLNSRISTRNPDFVCSRIYPRPSPFG